ncbi:MAG TPA: ROK family protein [Tepidisphaeraceae bacterium]|jgi:predicted NBD/HSP70 family sugar kinase
MIALGIDIGGTAVKAAARKDGRVLWAAQSPFYAKPTIEEIRAAIRQTVAGRLTDLHTVGLCVPGLFDVESRSISMAINVPGLVGISLDHFVPDTLGLIVDGSARILNDARAAAHDIYSTRQTKGRLLVLALGTGVGSAVLDNGKPLIVEETSPGHLGQIDVSIAGHPVIGPDGGSGGLEGYIGVAALRKRYGEDVSAALATFKGNEPPMLALVRAIRICHAIYRPEHICLCGGIGIRLRHILPVLREKIEAKLTSLARPGWTFTAGDDDFHAARGAATLAGIRLGFENP